MEEEKARQRFNRVKEKHPDRIDAVANEIAKIIKRKPHSVLRVSDFRSYLGPFYQIFGRGKSKVTPEVFDMAWREVIEKASEFSGVRLEFLPTAQRRRKHAKEMLRIIGVKSPSVQRAGERYGEVLGLDEALRKVPEVRGEFKLYRKSGGHARIKPAVRLYTLVSRVTGLKPMSVDSTRKKARRFLLGKRRKK